MLTTRQTQRLLHNVVQSLGQLIECIYALLAHVYYFRTQTKHRCEFRLNMQFICESWHQKGHNEYTNILKKLFCNRICKKGKERNNIKLKS